MRFACLPSSAGRGSSGTWRVLAGTLIAVGLLSSGAIARPNAEFYLQHEIRWRLVPPFPLVAQASATAAAPSPKKDRGRLPPRRPLVPRDEPAAMPDRSR